MLHFPDKYTLILGWVQEVDHGDFCGLIWMEKVPEPNMNMNLVMFASLGKLLYRPVEGKLLACSH